MLLAMGVCRLPHLRAGDAESGDHAAVRVTADARSACRHPEGRGRGTHQANHVATMALVRPIAQPFGRTMHVPAGAAHRGPRRGGWQPAGVTEMAPSHLNRLAAFLLALPGMFTKASAGPEAGSGAPAVPMDAAAARSPDPPLPRRATGRRVSPPIRAQYARAREAGPD